MSRGRRRHLELVSMHGSPTEAEADAIASALEALVADRRSRASDPMWAGINRAAPRRSGSWDLAGRLGSADLWRLSVRIAPGGREYPGRRGRGDAR